MNSLAPQSAVSPPRLLIVDDAPSNIDVLVGILKIDYELKIANSGAKALKICQAPEYIDLILLDIMMPEMDGFDVCRTLRERSETHDTPIIFLTAKTEVEDIVRGFDAGANDFVTKPFWPDELRSRVRTHLTLRAQQREIERTNTELKELLHIVCHDVANHFAVLSIAADIIKRRTNLTDEEYMPHMLAAIRNGIALTRLVRELRFSEDKKLPLGSVALKPAVEEALLLAKDKLVAKGLKIALDVPDINVVAEPASLINSVLGNVLSNAIKFSTRGGLIEIAARTHTDHVQLSIRDFGIGMPPNIREQIFAIAESHSRPGTEGERGTGFGMPLMQRFVRQYGGTVEVVSNDATLNPENHGTEFRIELLLAS